MIRITFAPKEIDVISFDLVVDGIPFYSVTNGFHIGCPCFIFDSSCADYLRIYNLPEYITPDFYSCFYISEFHDSFFAPSETIDFSSISNGSFFTH